MLWRQNSKLILTNCEDCPCIGGFTCADVCSQSLSFMHVAFPGLPDTGACSDCSGFGGITWEVPIEETGPGAGCVFSLAFDGTEHSCTHAPNAGVSDKFTFIQGYWEVASFAPGTPVRFRLFLSSNIATPRYSYTSNYFSTIPMTDCAAALASATWVGSNNFGPCGFTDPVPDPVVSVS